MYDFVCLLNFNFDTLKVETRFARFNNMELKEWRRRKAMLCHLLLLVILLSLDTVHSVTGKLNRIDNCTFILDGNDKNMGLNFTQAKTLNSTNGLQNSDASLTFNPCHLIERVESSTYLTRNNNTITPPKDDCSKNSSLCLTVLVQKMIDFDNTFEYHLEDNPKDPAHPIVLLVASSSKTGWKVYIKMICNNTTDTLTVDVINYISMTTNFSYNSPNACLINLNLPGTQETHSAGFFRIFFVFVFFILFMYFVGGIIFKKLCFNAEGIEMLPHHLFWINLYHTTRDAFIYIMNGCKHPSPYDQI